MPAQTPEGKEEVMSLKAKLQIVAMTSPVETLAAFKTFSLLSPMDISSIPLTRIAHTARKFKESEASVRPELEAIQFYLYSQVIHSLEKVYPQYAALKTEHAEVLFRYRRFATKACLRSLYYLTVVCTRESRHSKHTEMQMRKHLILQGVDASIAKLFSDFFRTIRGQNFVTAMDKFMAAAPNMPYYDFVQCLCIAFTTEFAKSYGGGAWEAIAKTLRNGIIGAVSMTTMLDTSFTLAHNTGPIFNKSIYYRHQDNAALLFVLDLQRAGALPEGLRSGELKLKAFDGYTAVEGEIMRLVDIFYELNPNHPTTVDYPRLVQLGAVGDYSVQVDQAEAQETPPAWAKSKTLPNFLYTGTTLPFNPTKQPVNELKRQLA